MRLLQHYKRKLNKNENVKTISDKEKKFTTKNFFYAKIFKREKYLFKNEMYKNFLYEFIFRQKHFLSIQKCFYTKYVLSEHFSIQKIFYPYFFLIRIYFYTKK